MPRPAVIVTDAVKCYPGPSLIRHGTARHVMYEGMHPQYCTDNTCGAALTHIPWNLELTACKPTWALSAEQGNPCQQHPLKQRTTQRTPLEQPPPPDWTESGNTSPPTQKRQYPVQSSVTALTPSHAHTHTGPPNLSLYLQSTESKPCTYHTLQTGRAL